VIYTSPKGVQFTFDGWAPGEAPLECFDRGDYIACAHGCMLSLIVEGNVYESFLAIQDDGIIHELIHLHDKIDICTCNTLPDIRAMVACLQIYVEEEVKRNATKSVDGL
jgi:hypothetical protein